MKRGSGAFAVCCFLGTFAVFSSLVARPLHAQSNSSQTKTAAPAEYVGSETCKTCHEELYKSWEKGPHWKQTLKEGGIAKHSCEDCHGAGSAHVADPALRTCLGFTVASLQIPNSRRDQLTANEMSCISSGCHDTIHNVKDQLKVKFWTLGQ
jgi:hypothetical protein